ncbi:MAG: hypothetical protein ACRDT2_05335 [Natronosporangium sp.]
MPIPRRRLVAAAAVLGLAATLWLPAAALAGPDPAPHQGGIVKIFIHRS